MMKIAYDIIKVQDALKSRYSDDEYSRIVNQLKSKSNEDLEVLAYMATDKMLSPTVRLFAVATMGEL